MAGEDRQAMKAFIGSDHAGIDGRKAVAAVLENRGWEVEHMGPSNADEKADYPDIAHDVAADALGMVDGVVSIVVVVVVIVVVAVVVVPQTALALLGFLLLL